MEQTNESNRPAGTGENSSRGRANADRVSKAATAPRTRFPTPSNVPTSERTSRFNWFLSLRRERPPSTPGAVDSRNDSADVKDELFINDGNNHNGHQHQGGSVFYTLRKRLQKKFTSVKVKAYEQDLPATLGTSTASATSNNYTTASQCNGIARTAGMRYSGSDFARIVIERQTQNPIRFSSPNANLPVINTRDSIPNTTDGNSASPTVTSRVDMVDENRQNMDDMMAQMRMELLQYGWYWGKLTRFAAQKRLAQQANGTFLVRDSQTEKHQFTASFRSSGITLHCRIDFENNYWSFSGLTTPTTYKTMVDLVEDTIKKSEYGVIGYVKQDSTYVPPFPVRLTKPINRFYEVSTLQHLCRFIIRQKINPRDIAELPLPEKLRKYVEENFYDL